ncbi:MAG: DUF4145 domain-containing protein [Pyrinomonadaceae bacterium]|nr:DUF4145 domain-containing protein [Pyrinomonadaceae bacterium]
MDIQWRNLDNVPPHRFVCGYCGAHTGPNRGYYPEGHRSDQCTDGTYRTIYICTYCESPTYFLGEQQTPGVATGNPLKHLPAIVAEAYDEARKCMSVGAYTAASLLCRKLLMNVAVAEGAKPGEHFIVYVNYLDSSGYIPPKGKPWVDRIRDLGNIATHEIKITNQPDAEQALTFIEMLLSFVYEMPGRLANP